MNFTQFFLAICLCLASLPSFAQSGQPVAPSCRTFVMGSAGIEFGDLERAALKERGYSAIVPNQNPYAIEHADVDVTIIGGCETKFPGLLKKCAFSVQAEWLDGQRLVQGIPVVGTDLIATIQQLDFCPR